MQEQVNYNEPIRPWDSMGQLEVFAQNYALGQAAIEELALLKPILALAIANLPKQQLKVTLTDQANLHMLELQIKREEKSGAVVFRAVKSVGN